MLQKDTNTLESYFSVGCQKSLRALVLQSHFTESLDKYQVPLSTIHKVLHKSLRFYEL